jgi:5'(3')-deoxyribonucleotidase
MDSTLNDFTSAYVFYYNYYFNDTVSLNHDDLYQYEISKCIPGISDDIAELRKRIIFNVPGYWYNIPPKPGIYDAVSWIYSHFNTYILTSPWLDSATCIDEKIKWIEKHLPFFNRNRIVFSMTKSIIHPHSILIDDKPQNLEEFPGIKIAFHYPFNKDMNVDGRIQSWSNAQQVLSAYL